MRGSYILTVAALVSAAPAFAVARVSTPVSLGFDELGSRYTINYNGYSSEIARPYLMAYQVIRLAAVSADKKSWTFQILQYKNTSTAPATQARLAGFGLDVTNAVVSSGSISGAGFLDTVRLGGNFPQIGTSEICFTPGNQCSSGTNQGLNLGQTLTTGTFIINLANAVNRITLDNFTVRYNAILGTGFNNATQASGSGLVAGNVFVEVLPEPGTWAQMIAGFGLIGAARRRQRRPLAA